LPTCAAPKARYESQAAVARLDFRYQFFRLVSKTGNAPHSRWRWHRIAAD
jgi:hypothetical protein